MGTLGIMGGTYISQSETAAICGGCWLNLSISNAGLSHEAYLRVCLSRRGLTLKGKILESSKNGIIGN